MYRYAWAKNFVRSGGGFSGLLGELVKQNGGFVGKTSIEAEIAHRFRHGNKPAENTHAVPKMVPLCLHPGMTSAGGCTACWVGDGGRIGEDEADENTTQAVGAEVPEVEGGEEVEEGGEEAEVEAGGGWNATEVIGEE